MKPGLIKSLRGLLKVMAAIPPFKLALWCLLISELRDLVRSLIELLCALKFMG
jgi:hypothetical protein